jgi:hypothetical protein
MATSFWKKGSQNVATNPAPAQLTLKAAIESLTEKCKKRPLPYWEIGFNTRPDKRAKYVPASALPLDPTPGIPHRIAAMQKYLCSGDKVAREKHIAKVRWHIYEEHHLNRRWFVGDFEHFSSFLSIIGRKYKKIDEIAFGLVVETFFDRHRPDTISFDNLGRVDLDVQHPLKESRHLSDPKYEKYIIAFQVYSAWVVVGKSFPTLVYKSPAKLILFFKWQTNPIERSTTTAHGPKMIKSAHTSSF